MNTEKKIQPQTESDITSIEKKLLDESSEKDITGDDEVLTRAALDNTDEDGETLNEKSSADDISGEDLDVPGSEDDDESEMTGNEDEENNNYSEADTE